MVMIIMIKQNPVIRPPNSECIGYLSKCFFLCVFCHFNPSPATAGWNIGYWCHISCQEQTKTVDKLFDPIELHLTYVLQVKHFCTVNLIHFSQQNFHLFFGLTYSADFKLTANKTIDGRTLQTIPFYTYNTFNFVPVKECLYPFCVILYTLFLHRKHILSILLLFFFIVALSQMLQLWLMPANNLLHPKRNWAKAELGNPSVFCLLFRTCNFLCNSGERPLLSLDFAVLVSFLSCPDLDPCQRERHIFCLLCMMCNFPCDSEDRLELKIPGPHSAHVH